MANLFTVEKLPATSAEAIRAFEENYLAGVSVAAPPSWARDHGDVGPTDSPDVTYPIGILSTQYQRTEGDSRFQSMAEKSFRVQVAEFDAGYEAPLLDLTTKAYAYRKWLDVPSRFINAEERHVNRTVKGLLEDSGQTSPWDGELFFDTDHKANPKKSSLGTFSNLQATPSDPSDIDDLTAEVTAMRGVLDENGEKLGVEPDTILLPTIAFQRVMNVLANQQLIGENGAGVTNPFLGKFKLVHVPELNEAGTWHWYLVDSKIAREAPPWGVLKYVPAASLGLRAFDESSDFFKNTGRIKVTSHIWYGAALIFPHAIRKITGTLPT